MTLINAEINCDSMPKVSHKTLSLWLFVLLQFIRTQISQYLRAARDGISYKDLAQHMSQFVGEGDMNWTNFMIMFHVGKKVLLELNSIRPIATQHFRRYVGHQYAEQVAQWDDVVRNYIFEEKSRLSIEIGRKLGKVGQLPLKTLKKPERPMEKSPEYPELLWYSWSLVTYYISVL